MNRHKQQFAVSFILCGATILPIAARAQEFGAAATLYNNGVQAYFRGCSVEADSCFSSLIGVDPNDPRAFYFRAFSRWQQGREDEARTDMQVGAQLEARSPNRFDIGKTLERVQGPTRLLLEQYRRQAHQSAALNPPRGAVRSPDAAVLRERRVVPLDEFSHPGQPQSIIAPAPVQETVNPPALPKAQPAQDLAPAGPPDPFNDDVGAKPSSKPKPKAPPAKAAAPTTPPTKAPLPSAPKKTTPPPEPSVKVEKDDNPF